MIHLYYFESWQLFSQKLRALASIPFDLFVTLPRHNMPFAATIRRDYPRAYILEVPNRGRDILPFMKLAPALIEAGYEYSLKLHSKKSAHRTDGNDWMSDMVDKLLPSDEGTLQNLVSILQDTKTGIVGPEGHYLSLVVNFGPNSSHILSIVRELFTSELSDRVKHRCAEYGFFAGTMFWARLDAIKPISDRHFEICRYEPEQGQIDATFAHALERVFSLVPELNGRNMYALDKKGGHLLDYSSTNIPDWSNVYIGPPPPQT